MSSHAARLARFNQPGLYVVITEAYCAGRPPLDVLDAVLRAGVRLVQFREKTGSDRARYALAEAFRARTRDAGALLIVDDRVDLALAVDADGVHLGEHDLPIEAARRCAPDLIIGASSHNLEEALANQAAGASYVNIGPIFATQTKDVPTGPLGPEAIGAIAPKLRVPFTVMGGIKLENLDALLAEGARRVAVVTAVTAAPDPGHAARALQERICAAL